MNGRSRAVEKAAIAALLLLMVGLSCKSAPVKRCSGQDNQPPHDCTSFNRTISAKMGRYILSDAYPEGFNRTNDSMCDLFSEYSRLSVTLENHEGNDSLHTNLTLLVMIAKKVLVDTCKIEANSTIDCSSIASISKHCLYPRKEGNSSELNLGIHPGCWSTEFYQSNRPSLHSNSSVWNTYLKNMKELGSNCTLNETDATVTCKQIIGSC